MAVETPSTGPIEVRSWTQVGQARRTVISLAAQIGFAKPVLDDMAIVVSELAGNLVKHHTIRGTLTATYVEAGPRRGMELIAMDLGPGIADLRAAELDGVSTRGTLGGGLGAIRRLMDTCDICSARGTGTRIVCRKWLPLATQPGTQPPREFDISVQVRCYPGERVCGDQYFVDQSNGVLTVGVIDGLGHGPLAQAAAVAALDYVRSNFRRGLVEIFEGAHRACRGTRGAAMTLAQLDLLKGTLSYTGVGNVALRMISPQGSMSGLLSAGTLGLALHKVHVMSNAWIPNSILVIYSDGVSSRRGVEPDASWFSEPLQELSARLFQSARPDDDATLLVAR
jgi:anti-sigma regulatory factor (Ser/Thr protein kinase)